MMAAEPPAKLVLGVDDSEHSAYALQWTARHFFSGGAPPPFKLIVVYAKPTPSSIVGIAGPGAGEAMNFVQMDLKRLASKVIDEAKEICAANSINNVEFEVTDGDARTVLVDAAEKHHADLLVVGSHGYGAIKRAVLGSVSDYCAHQAHCTVMVVKMPKQKQ